jgi:hypothetical protein
MTDVLDWTDAGRAALATELARAPRSLHAATDAELRAAVDAVVARFGPCWERGAAASDVVGRAAIAFACGDWRVDGITIDQAAGMASLLGARSDDDAGAFAELVMRARGIEVGLRVLVAMWSLVTDYDDPDYPDEARLAIRLGVLPADSSAAEDASVSHGKGDMAEYLGARHRASTASDQAHATRAAHAMLPMTPAHARAPLAVAVQDRALATSILRELFANPKRAVTPHYAWRTLPSLVRDRDLLEQLAATDHLPFTFAWLEALGPQVIPLYATAIGKRTTSAHQRKTMIQQLVNIHGPGAAAILARYAGTAPYRPLIRAYFARHPELR